MKRVNREDRYQLMSGAVTTAEGYLRDSPIVARTGIYEYLQPDGSVRREYRPPSEVFAEDALDSFMGKPVTALHPKSGRVTAATAAKDAIGAILSPGYSKDNGNVACDIIIYQPDKIGKNRELSVGYKVDLEETPGVTDDGQRYDAIQRNIRVNHLAVVPKARAGSKARLNLDGDGIYCDENGDDQKMAKIRIDNAEVEVSEQVATYVSALTMKADAAVAKADSAEAKLQTVTAELATAKNDAAAAATKLDGMAAERDALKAKVDAAEADKKAAVDKAVETAKKEIKERTALEETAKKAKVEKADGMDNKALKIAVIKAVRGDSFDMDGKSEAYIDAAYDFAAADVMKNDGSAVKGQLDAFKANGGGTQTAIKSDADDARAKMIASLNGNAKEEK